MDNEKVIREFVLEALLDSDVTVTKARPLFSTRLLDSMALVELVGFLEKTFKIKVAPMDIATENLDSIEKMADFVDRKRGSCQHDV